jgi:hypothetical protein
VQETMVQFSTGEDLEEKIYFLETKVKSLEVLCDQISTDMTEQETSAESFRENGGNAYRENFQSRTKSLRNRFGNQSKYKSRGLFLSDSDRKPSVVEEKLTVDDDYKDLSQDTFSLMLLSQPFSKQWFFGVAVFLLQGTLLMMIAFDQISASKGSTPFDVPYRVPPVVHAGQLLAIIISVATQTDLVTAIVSMLTLSPGQRHYWTTLIKVPEDSSLWVWAARVAFPIALELVEGGFVLFTTFVIVIQSDNIIDLFKDFAAMQLISELDNMVRRYELHFLRAICFTLRFLVY